MKRPIEPSEIRPGDLIRCEALDDDGFGADHILASEFRAGDRFYNPVVSSVRYYLLDRPEPAVEIPREPGLGWLGVYGHRELAIWRRGDEGLEGTPTLIYRVPRDITEFTRATAVPTEALDALRDEALTWARLDANSVVGKFLTAIDQANAS